MFRLNLVSNGWGITLSNNKCQWTLLIEVNIGSGDGLVPSGNKPLPEPMLTQIYVNI